MACLVDRGVAGHHGRSGHLRDVAAGMKPGLTEVQGLKAAGAASGTGGHPKGS